MNNGKMIAIWGNKGCGKSTTAVKLAAKLAEMKKEVILVLTDITAPDINVLLPFSKDIHTMGNIWATPDCSIEAIYKACNTTKSNFIGVLAYKNGENVFSHADYTKDNIMDVFMKLKNMADYIIVDCVDVFAYNVLTTVALELADQVIRLGEATTKAFSFFDSNLPLLQDSRYKYSQHLKVLVKVKSYQAKDAAISHYGGIHTELPYVEELERQMLEGELFHLTDSKAMKLYDSGLMSILDFIMKDKTEGVAIAIENEENVVIEEKAKGKEDDKKTFSPKSFLKRDKKMLSEFKSSKDSKSFKDSKAVYDSERKKGKTKKEIASNTSDVKKKKAFFNLRRKEVS